MPQNCMMEPEYTGESACCFCFPSTKKSVARNGKRSSGVLLSSEHVEWGKNDEILSDTSTFSVKEQERRLKKALEEEERASKEAERIVKWVKQESARIDVSAIKSILSDEKEANVK
ncbi:hypothetical protein AAZX31_01G138200 [Glycine max]|nr:uncharacterized protein LOC102666935 [Glycine max]XP_028239616.1 uncharacterized protein LOC114418463 [Glycine soja]KAG4403600.1 hypothetical protein GLYMA_01G151000v4 [Glycine max]KAG5089246.1 hypothetical protein JHK86_001858 [Glycine max]KAH1163194.1 hypothetical protein GYH30_001637 [Glycine max]KAH1266677.1 hypothetical protein GmHk_01G002115 [Glycine max]KHN41750.1 hypothetical protein glysoja_003490 [Glycine soja]|eukprot:XP_025984267.1 uncharacterized protein LOC102666935 [Glycine max]